MQFMTDDQIRAKAPSVFATHAAANVSEKYAYLPTYQAVRDMRTMGLEVASVREGYKRSPEGRNFAIHELRMRRPGDVAQGRQLGELFPEVILRNSHDRTSGFDLSAGLFRLVCLNGMTVADHAFNVKLRHVGRNQVDKLYAGVAQIIESLPRTIEIAASWREINLASEQIERLANRAAEIRGSSLMLDAGQILRLRRWDDQGSNLWSVFNRLQENLTVGGMRGHNATGQRRRLQGIRTLAADVNFNQKLWTAASELAAEVRGISVAFA